MGKSTLTTAEIELVIQILSTAQLSGDAASLRSALDLIDSIVNKLTVEIDEPLESTNQ